MGVDIAVRCVLGKVHRSSCFVRPFALGRSSEVRTVVPIEELPEPRSLCGRQLTDVIDIDRPRDRTRVGPWAQGRARSLGAAAFRLWATFAYDVLSGGTSMKVNRLRPTLPSRETFGPCVMSPRSTSLVMPLRTVAAE